MTQREANTYLLHNQRFILKSPIEHGHVIRICKESKYITYRHYVLLFISTLRKKIVFQLFSRFISNEF